MATNKIEKQIVENPAMNEICNCTGCNKPICQNADLASCERLVRGTDANGFLDQTGGMCHAAKWEMPGLFIFTEGVGAVGGERVEVLFASSEEAFGEDSDNCIAVLFDSEPEALQAIRNKISEHQNRMMTI